MTSDLKSVGDKSPAKVFAIIIINKNGGIIVAILTQQNLSRD